MRWNFNGVNFKYYVLVVDCGDPGMLVNGLRLSLNETTYMSKVRYFCKPGYLFTGSREMICQENGLWTGQKPTCKGKDLKLLLALYHI